MEKAAIGIIGLGVMGQSLALNMERNGFSVAGFDLDALKMRAFLQTRADQTRIRGADTLPALVAGLEKPRRILIMVPAGPPVDSVIASLTPLLAPDDILIDGGNSYFMDTERRAKSLAQAGFQFVGMGVSGGEEGALWGPSLMPGGPLPAWEALAPILTAIAAKAPDGQPCVTYIGPGGAGHYVKMVHNGIEYGDMQLIAEIYDFLSRGLRMKAVEIADLFADWNRAELQSYLVEITAEILRAVDPDTGRPLVEVILDQAGQKGTGKWTSQNALDLPAAIPTINAAVEARIISALKVERVAASKILTGPEERISGDRDKLVRAARSALYASKLTSYAQGMALLALASVEYRYSLNLGEIASIWRAGCIIRAGLLDEIRQAYRSAPNLTNLLLSEQFRGPLAAAQPGWRLFVQAAVGLGVPVPACSASLAYYDLYRSAVLPANLIQAQRDFFGAHTYQRVDREGVFHTDWTGI